MLKHALLAAAALAAMAASGCTGDLGSTEDDGESSGSGEPVGPDTEALCAAGNLPGPRPRMVRLTHAQYDATVRDLLRVAGLSPSAEFIDDPAFSGFTNNAEGLLVSDRLARDYRRAAEALSEVAITPEVAGALVPCEVPSGDEACARDFVVAFGERAFRRPLTPDEVDRFMALYARANGNFASGTPFEQGIRHLVEAFLQSPSFLYRVELSEELDSDQLIPLDGYEIASRLSYLIWNSMPDDDLLAAAAAGELDTEAGIEAQARRLIADARSLGPVDDFHEQWLQLAKYDNVTKDAGAYPGFGAETMASMKEETRRFIRHVAIETSGNFDDLLTSRTTFVDARLAAIYGLDGEFGDDFVQVELDASRRAGLLTQPGFLASHAYPDGSSPIHRGVFVQRRVLCVDIPDPPGDIDTTLPPFSDTIRTTKQQVENHTSPDACVGCHALINAPGYALENFDGVGAWRDTDNGEPVDPTGEFVLDEDLTSVAGPMDLVDQLVASDDAGRCYLRQWYRYGFARAETEADECTMEKLAEQLGEGGYNVKELLVAFTKTKTFRFRIGEEVGQ